MIDTLLEDSLGWSQGPSVLILKKMEDDPKISLFFQKQPPTMPAEVQRHPSVLPE